MTRWMTSAWGAAALYAVIAVAMSWPLPPQITRALAGDMGDPLLNAWILAWGADHFTAMLGGDLGAFSRWWQANIFHPAPLTLAYSEHLAPQVLLGLPFWWLSGNVLLVYNLLFLSTSAISGLGMFLLVRELTGRPRAALVAGLFFAFLPYRVAQLPHLQVLSSQWMPLALYGFRCYLERGHARALAGAVLALAAQQLSCGYYLMYFSPFVALYLIWEITSRRRWSDWRLLAALAAAAIADLAIAWPFLSPYLQLRELGFAPRPLAEVIDYSADVHAYVTAHETNRFWGGWLAGRGRAENELFPGLLPVAAALAGLAALAIGRWRATASLADPTAWRWASVVLGASVLIGAAGALAFLATASVNLRLGDIPVIRVRNLGRPIVLMVAGLLGLLALSDRARAWFRLGTDVRGIALVLLSAAVVLSWGPEPRSDLKPLRFTGPYLWLYQYVPGFDGLRVPARMAMVAYVFLSLIAGYGLAAVDRLRRGALVLAIVGAAFLVEATGVPITIGHTSGEAGVATPPGVVRPAATAPDVYRVLGTMPAGTVIAEFPFGFTGWELRYVYYAAVHRQRLLNGYSGGFPDVYQRHVAALRQPTARPDLAWRTLVAAGVTHVVVHRNGFLGGADAAVVEWLERRGARKVGTYRSDELYQLPR